MPAAPAPTQSLRYLSLLLSLGGTGGGGVPVSPTSDKLSLAYEPGGEDAFYFRRKLSGPLVFEKADYELLYALENSTDRCQTLYLTLEARAQLTGPVGLSWRGTFTCNDITFDTGKCTASVTPLPADGYQELFDTWDRPVNLLSAPAFDPAAGRLRTVTAQLAELPQGQQIEFRRIGQPEEMDFVGTDGWAVFLRNTSYIGGGTRDESVLIFRYRLRAVPMKLDEFGAYQPLDLSAAGWQFFTRDDTVSPPTADYVKAPEIAGLKVYQIGTFDDWYHTEGGRRPRYGTDLLLLPCGQQPSAYGFSNDGYVEVTGTGGAVTDTEDEQSPCLNVRRSLTNSNYKSLWWKFGQFSFSRCFPLLDGLYHVLQQTAPQLLPPQPTDLSSFLTHPTNPATGLTGSANEIPSLLLSAGSDVKRYGASEPATRLLISCKQLLTDVCTLWDLGYDIDPLTGWLRIEHRSFYEQREDGLVLDLTTTSPEGYALTAVVPKTYQYLSAQLPQYEQLSISAAVTEEFDRGISFREGEIEYSGACVNTREGQNTQVRTVQRLTGDLAGLVLSGDALPDTAIALLDVGPDGAVRNGNRALASSELLRRYHTHGRVRPTGIVRAATTEEGEVVTFASVRLAREQTGVSVRLCSAELLSPSTKVLTALGPNGRLAKATLELQTGVVTLTVRYPAPEGTAPGPLLRARQFSNSFDPSAG
ncbi:hypothetical protein [Hymenobacter tenuis]